MEDEFDLARYVRVLTRHWKLIAGLGILAALLALLVSLIIPPQYEAASLVTATHPQYQLQFDPRIQTLTNLAQSQPYKALPDLALSDELLNQVVNKLGEAVPVHQRDLTVFRRQLSARAGSDPSLLRLAVTGDDPHQAQTIATTWAELYVPYVNDLYQQHSTTAIFFAGQADEARQTLEAAEQKLIDYQAVNPINVVTAELASKQAALANYLATGQKVSLLIQDAGSLQQQLAQQKADGTVALADQLSALYLQVGALNTSSSVPIQLQIPSGGSLADQTPGEQIAALTTLVKALQDKAIFVQQQAKALEPDILELQKEQQAAQVDLSRLTRDRDVAQETYLALTRKLDEVNVTAQDTSGVVQLASQAALPTEPTSPRKGANMVLGGLLGLLLGAGAAFLLESRRTQSGGSPRQIVNDENNGQHESGQPVEAMPMAENQPNGQDEHP